MQLTDSEIEEEKTIKENWLKDSLEREKKWRKIQIELFKHRFKLNRKQIKEWDLNEEEVKSSLMETIQGDKRKWLNQ
jgi:hypothetical protein